MRSVDAVHAGWAKAREAVSRNSPEAPLLRQTTERLIVAHPAPIDCSEFLNRRPDHTIAGCRERRP
ncbi:MAG: hypothetical protein HC826_01120 [Rhodospirillales bacterium]|nr:hypothetical protein [Rhodospirillales bacterium]